MIMAYILVYVSVIIPLDFLVLTESGGSLKNIFYEKGTIVESSIVKQAEAWASLRFAVEALLKSCFYSLPSFNSLRQPIALMQRINLLNNTSPQSFHFIFLIIKLLPKTHL